MHGAQCTACYLSGSQHAFDYHSRWAAATQPQAPYPAQEAGLGDVPQGSVAALSHLSLTRS